MEAIKSQVRDLYDHADEDGRRQLQSDLLELQSSLYTDWDIVARLSSGPFQLSLVKIGSDLHIFEKLAVASKENAGLTLPQLATETGADLSLLGHLLRAIAAFGMIEEVGKDHFVANRMTSILANVDVAGMMTHVFDIHAVVAHALPEFLADRKYAMITSNEDVPFQKAFNTDLAAFDWLKQHPEHMESLGHAMAMQRAVHWIDSYPVEEEVGSFTPVPDSALLVDIGGGFGQQAIAFRKRFPNLPGRVVVQDIPETLGRATASEEVEFMAQDFFEPQGIKSAKFYYLRHVLHDWTDDDCVRILKAIVPVMGPHSRIVIDEVVLPDANVPWQAAYMDLTMMSVFGGIERTKAEFEKVLERAGLKVADVHRYDPKMQSVILAVPK